MGRSQRISAGRWVLRCLLCAGLGLATTVGVAWTLAALLPHRGLTFESEVVFSDSKPRGQVERYDAPLYLITEEVRRPGMARRAWTTRNTATSILLPLLTPWTSDQVAHRIQHETPGLRLRRDWGECPLGPGEGASGFEDARGWPWLALCSHGREGVLAATEPRYSYGVRLAPDSSDGYLLQERVLPLRPLWSGLLGNSAVYAGGWAASWSVVGYARRRLRRARGWCGACGYDLAGLRGGDGCPECGLGREGAT